MITKEDYLNEIYCVIMSSKIENIRVAKEIFKHYDLDIDKEIPDEHGNIFCDDCEYCFNCVNCSGCENCKQCWCLSGNNDGINEFSTIDDVTKMRDEPFNEMDNQEFERCIKLIDEHIKIISKNKHDF